MCVRQHLRDAGRARDGLAAVAEKSRFVALPVARAFGGALVMQLLTACQCDFDLRSTAIIKVDLGGHQRHAIALDRADQPVDLAAVEQESARPARLMVEAVALQIFWDVGVDEIDFITFVGGIAFGDGRLALA